MRNILSYDFFRFSSITLNNSQPQFFLKDLTKILQQSRQQTFSIPQGTSLRRETQVERFMYGQNKDKVPCSTAHIYFKNHMHESGNGTKHRCVMLCYDWKFNLISRTFCLVEYFPCCIKWEYGYNEYLDFIWSFSQICSNILLLYYAWSTGPGIPVYENMFSCSRLKDHNILKVAFVLWKFGFDATNSGACNSHYFTLVFSLSSYKQIIL